MNRNLFLRFFTYSLGTILTQPSFIFAQTFVKAGFQVKMLTDTIGIFTEKGGTILFYLGKKGITIVDTQFADTMVNLIKDLSDKGRTKFQLLINTHHHGDHTGGNIALKEKVTQIVGHKNCLINHKAGAEKNKTVEKQLFATETFDASWKKKLDKNETVKLHYFGAAHTNGDAVVEFTKNKIVHLGDLMFNRRFPFIDKSSGANIKSWISVLQQIQDKFSDDTKFVFGHAADKYNVVGTKADLKAFALYLTQLLEFVTQAVKDGKTKDEIVKSKAITGNTEWAGDGIERSLNAAYTEIVEGK